MSQTFHNKYKPYFLDDFAMDPNLFTVLRTLLALARPRVSHPDSK